MKPLREVLKEYRNATKALAHFNFSDSNQLKAIAEASKETGLPVLAALSEGEREHFPLVHARALIDAYQREGVQMYLSADHTYSLEKAKAAINAGVDAIVVDGAELSFADNEKLLMQVVAYAHSKKRFRGYHDTIIEGELGYIGKSSSLHDSLPEGVSEANLTTPEDAARLVKETGIDALAPAVGNVHGMLKNAKEPRLHPDRMKEIAKAAGVPLVLHGASGNSEEDIKACIAVGVSIVHINTELRVLYRDSLRDSLKGEETTPYKFLTPAVDAMREYLIHRVRLCAGL
ncbi:class II fructose-bisphosphate aldolase [Candidatus Nomurabacteria bacterium]|nr:class II fructose-bisphosphate aldolase [Candidatus Nomurabacteria bacterium]